MTTNKSRNALDGSITSVRKNLSVYKVKASPFYRARAWLPSLQKRIVRSTKAASRIDAIRTAEEWYAALQASGALTKPRVNQTFNFYADKLIDSERQRGERKKLHVRQWQTTRFYLSHKQWGLLKRFASSDITQLREKDYVAYLGWVKEVAPALKPATLNHIASTFSKVLKLARADGVIDILPSIPREIRHDNPRPFFQFHPLVPASADDYKRLLATARLMAQQKVHVRDSVITLELYEMILFITHTFVRPIESELYNLRHRDVAIAQKPLRLILTISGKTGVRRSNSLREAVHAYKRLRSANPLAHEDDYIFFPKYPNRSTAKRIAQRQFNALLERCSLKQDRTLQSRHSLYSLRHTAICMRIILSRGKVNIYNLAKNAGTSVNQIERFYAKRLPLTAEMAENLQTFGDPLPKPKSRSRRRRKISSLPKSNPIPP